MFWKRGNDEAKAETIKDIDLVLGIEAKYLTLTGGGVRLRLSRDDAGILTDRQEIASRFRTAEAPIDRREWNDEAAERFVKISRLFRHGLDLHTIARVMGEKESDVRAFWGWAVDRKLAREHPATSAVESALAADDLPLIPARVHFSVLNPAERITKVSLRGPRVAELMRDGSVHDAAKTLGVEVADLERWLADPINARMVEVLTK